MRPDTVPAVTRRTRTAMTATQSDMPGPGIGNNLGAMTREDGANASTHATSTADTATTRSAAMAYE